MRFLAMIVFLFVGLFASADQTVPAQAMSASAGASPVREQIIYQPPVQGQLVAVTAPCPSIQLAGGGTLQTAPWPYPNSSCVHYGTRANVTVPQGMAFEWRYYIPGPWWWPFPLEQTAIAYAGQSVSSDFLRLYYTPYPAYAPGAPYQPPPGYYPPPVTVPPPTYTPPMPGLPAPGTPVPSEIRTGVGQTLAFAAGWPVAGWRVQYVSGRTAYQCYTVTLEAGWLTDGIINPANGIAQHAPGPCP